MRLFLTKCVNTTQTIIIVPLTLSPLCLLLLVRLGVYTVKLCTFYSYRLIGKLTTFIQFQEFNFLNLTVTSSTSAARRSPRLSNRIIRGHTVLSDNEGRVLRRDQSVVDQVSGRGCVRTHVPRVGPDTSCYHITTTCDYDHKLH